MAGTSLESGKDKGLLRLRLQISTMSSLPQSIGQGNLISLIWWGNRLHDFLMGRVTKSHLQSSTDTKRKII